MKNKARVLLVDDDPLILSMLSRLLRGDGYQTAEIARPEEVVPKVHAWNPDIILLDVRLPGRSGIEVLQELVQEGSAVPVVMLTADDTAETAVRALKLGAADYVTKPYNSDEIKIIIRKLLENRALQREVSYLRRVQSEVCDHPLIGRSPIVLGILEQIDRMAEKGVNALLITGESGSGKELFARYAHARIRQGEQFAPYIAVNCAALPEALLESELFGHERGAFTGATTSKSGLFEVAQGGTIVLDEIGDLAAGLQAKLLRALEERVIRRIGGQADIPVETTVVAITNRDLGTGESDGALRKDLYYRLSTFKFSVPALRERKEDIPLLVDHFLSLFRKRYKNATIERFSAEAMQCLSEYGWPGNIRELRNVVERIVVLEQAREILPVHLPQMIRGGRPESADGSPLALPPDGISLDDLERDLIRQALVRTRHNKAQAAKLLGLTYDALRYQVKKFGLE